MADITQSRLFIFIVAFLIAASHASPILNPLNHIPNISGKRAVGYYVNWAIYDRNFTPQEIPSEYLTHVNYAFANVRNDTGEVYLTDTWSDIQKKFPTDSLDETGTNVYGCVKQLFLLKKRNRKLKTLLAIGGWTFSPNFAPAVATDAGRKMFASSAVQLVADLGFDGLDIDWEYPQGHTEAQNFVLLLKEIRHTLDAYTAQYAPGQKLLLTIVAPAGSADYSQLLMSKMDKYLDFWNLMGYEYAGSYSSVTAHTTNVYNSSRFPDRTPSNTDDVISAYIAGGVAPSKIVLGSPLYGRSFESTAGLGTPFTGMGEGSWDPGTWDYKTLPKPGAVEKSDTELIAGWSYDPNSEELISYDTPTTSALKAMYINMKGLGGEMWWELSGDKPITDERSLINVTVQSFGGCSALEATQNIISYPTSKYDNLRNGFPNE